MANLGLIDFKLSLYIEVNVNDGQKQIVVHISKHLAINWHKIGQMRLLGKKIKWASLGHFHPILTPFFKCSFFEDKSDGDNY